MQHHAAHASALAGEHPDVERWLVFAWDGVGYGSDGTLWGGEALAGRPGEWQRRGSFRPFHLVGGDKAGREPWRSAAALLWAEGRDMDLDGSIAAGDRGEVASGRHASLLPLARQAWQRRRGTFESSAAGRLFDAAAALVSGRHFASFEGQGPMELEQLAADGCEAVPMHLRKDEQGIWRSDWAPLLDTLGDSQIPASERAGIFHESMAQALIEQALAVRAETSFDAVGLSGGVFQNRRLTELVADKLDARGIELRLHESVPANDGGLCFGQVVEAAALNNGIKKPQRKA